MTGTVGATRVGMGAADMDEGAPGAQSTDDVGSRGVDGGYCRGDEGVDNVVSRHG